MTRSVIQSLSEIKQEDYRILEERGRKRGNKKTSPQKKRKSISNQAVKFVCF